MEDKTIIFTSNILKEKLKKIKFDKSLRLRKKISYFKKDIPISVSFKLDNETYAYLFCNFKDKKVEFIFEKPSLKYSEKAKEDKEYIVKKEREKELRLSKQKKCLWYKNPFEKYGEKGPVLHHKNMSKMIKSIAKLKEIVAKEILEGKISFEYGIEKLDEADISIL